MSKIILSTILLITFITIVTNAQNVTAKVYRELDNVKVIVLELSGSTTLEPMQGNKINILSILNTEGDNLGN